MNKAKEISMAEFEGAYAERPTKISWQALAIKNMAIGTAIRLTHAGMKCRREVGSCSIKQAAFRYERVSKDRFFKATHATDNGDILVACYAKEVK